MVWDGEKYLAAAESGAYTSEDGVEWMKLDHDMTGKILYAIACGDKSIIAGAGTGSGRSGMFVGSIDGAPWQALSDGEAGYTIGQNGDRLFEKCPYSIEYIDGVFLAVGLNRISDGFILYSSDGVHWVKKRGGLGQGHREV